MFFVVIKSLKIYKRDKKGLLMRVQAVDFKTYTQKVKRANFSNTFSNSMNEKVDSFDRQSSDILFTGVGDDKNSKKLKKENSLSNSMKNVAIKGKPFLLGLVTSAAMVKMGADAEELLFDSDGYSISEDSIKSSLVNIDSDEQIIEFKGTGIEIDADDYDFVDWENGIFKNFDGSVDIDLGNNKFIDTIHGIFVDPDERVSAIMDGNYLQSMAIPSFGSGYPTCPWDDRWSTMSQPENVKEGSKFGVLGEWLRGDYKNSTSSNNDESAMDKIGTFLRGLFKKDSMPDTNGMKDIFGNDMILAKDKDGDAYFASYMKAIDSNPLFAQFRNTVGKENVAEAVNNEHLRQYIEKNHPGFGMRIPPYMLDKNRIHMSEQTPDVGLYIVNPLTADLNKNGIPDYLEKGLSTQEAIQDINNNGIPDFLENDSNGNSIPDYLDIDENNNGIPDFFENDSNGNLIPDFLEIDENDNGIPDFIENLLKKLFGAE